MDVKFDRLVGLKFVLDLVLHCQLKTQFSKFKGSHNQRV